MKRVILLSMTAFLVILLMLSSVAYAFDSPDESQPVNLEIGNELGIKGKPPKPPKPQPGNNDGVATGILGEDVEGERYAVIIGISDYPGDLHVLQGGLDLSYADDDAIAMRDTLVAPIDSLYPPYGYGFNPDNIILLLGQSDITDPETQSVATREAILGVIDDLADEVVEGDEVVFFFSGHGTIQQGNNSKGKKSDIGSNVGIITWDDEEENIAIIWDYELKEAFGGFSTDRIIYIFDCCNAGGMTELEGNGVICMATTENGLSAEYGQDYGQTEQPYINHGLFTYFFVVLGMQYGLADIDSSDGVVTIEEAYDFARSELESLSRSSKGQLRQIPTIIDNFNNDLLL